MSQTLLGGLPLFLRQHRFHELARIQATVSGQYVALAIRCTWCDVTCQYDHITIQEPSDGVKGEHHD